MHQLGARSTTEMRHMRCICSCEAANALEKQGHVPGSIRSPALHKLQTTQTATQLTVCCNQNPVKDHCLLTHLTSPTHHLCWPLGPQPHHMRGMAQTAAAVADQSSTWQPIAATHLAPWPMRQKKTAGGNSSSRSCRRHQEAAAKALTTGSGANSQPVCQCVTHSCR